MKHGVLPALILLLAPAWVEAHALGESYLFLSFHPDRMKGRVEIPLAHLDEAVGLESDQDGKITEPEFQAGSAAAQAYVAERIGFSVEGRPLRLTYGVPTVVRASLAQYAAFPFAVHDLAALPAGIEVHDALMFDVDSTHRSLLIVEFNHRTGVVNTTEAVSLVFEPGRERQSLDLSYRSEVFRSLAFVGHGLWHGATEPNHALILAALFLPTVVIRAASGWEPVAGLLPVVKNCARIAFLFGCSHAVGFLFGIRSGTALPALDWAIVAAIAATCFTVLRAQRDDTAWAALGFGWLFGLSSVPAWTALKPEYGSTLSPFVAMTLGLGLSAAVFAVVITPLLYELRTRELFTRRLIRYGLVLLPVIGIVRVIYESVETPS